MRRTYNPEFIQNYPKPCEQDTKRLNSFLGDSRQLSPSFEKSVTKYTASGDERWTHLEPQRPERTIALSAMIFSPPLRNDLQISHYSHIIRGVEWQVPQMNAEKLNKVLLVRICCQQIQAIENE
jgi:hypothetical protein